MISSNPFKRFAFTMGELLVVIFLVAILLGLIIKVVQKFQEAHARTRTISHLKQLTLPLHSCNDVHRGLPPAFDQFAKMNFPASVHVHLLPFIEEGVLYKNYLLTQGGEDASNGVVSPFSTPQDRSHRNMTKGIQNIAANLRVFSDKGEKTKFDGSLPALAAVEPGTASIPKTFKDGTSNTIVFATKLAVCGTGGSRYAAAPDSQHAAFFGQDPALVPAHPSDATATFQVAPDQSQCLCTPLMAQSFEQSGLNVGLGDGSVRTLSAKISPQTWNYAMQPNDGNNLGSDWDF